jgi:uncharacterized protein GlcG (DUF336 family)
MATLSLTQAVAIADAALQRARELGLQPITVTVLDPGGHPQVLKRELRGRTFTFVSPTEFLATWSTMSSAVA